MRRPLRKRTGMIVIAGLLMLATVVIIGEWITASDSAAANRRALAVSEPSRLVSEQSGFARSAQALDYLRSAEGGTRTISEFYGLRAYLGAPPSVPHPIDDAKSLGGKACLVCHGDGGGVKGVGFNNIGAAEQVFNMNGFDKLRLAEYQ